MSCEEPKFGKPSRYEIVNLNSYDPNTMQPTVQAVVVDSSKPLFQNNDFKYNDRAFQAYMKYDDMKFKDLEDYPKALAEIEKEFEFRVWVPNNFTTAYPRVYMSLGDLRVERGLESHRYGGFRFEPKLEDFKMIFETFKELLAAYSDMVGEKRSIMRRKGDNTLYNKPLEDYFHKVMGLGGSTAQIKDPTRGFDLVPSSISKSYEEHVKKGVDELIKKNEKDKGVWVEKNGTKVKIQAEISKAIMQAAKEKDIKSRRKYELGSVDICDDVYNQVVEWIESRKDFIYVDYNNMKQY